jgi:hypothetical protein
MKLLIALMLLLACEAKIGKIHGMRRQLKELNTGPCDSVTALPEVQGTCCDCSGEGFCSSGPSAEDPRTMTCQQFCSNAPVRFSCMLSAVLMCSDLFRMQRKAAANQRLVPAAKRAQGVTSFASQVVDAARLYAAGTGPATAAVPSQALAHANAKLVGQVGMIVLIATLRCFLAPVWPRGVLISGPGCAVSAGHISCAADGGVVLGTSCCACGMGGGDTCDGFTGCAAWKGPGMNTICLHCILPMNCGCVHRAMLLRNNMLDWKKWL